MTYFVVVSEDCVEYVYYENKLTGMKASLTVQKFGGIWSLRISERFILCMFSLFFFSLREQGWGRDSLGFQLWDEM